MQCCCARHRVTRRQVVRIRYSLWKQKPHNSSLGPHIYMFRCYLGSEAKSPQLLSPFDPLLAQNFNIAPTQ